jgi:hypothetical protein
MRVKPGILILDQDLSVPFDRRVGFECQAGLGGLVAVVCPKGRIRSTGCGL